MSLFIKNIKEMVSSLESREDILVNHFCLLNPDQEKILLVEKELGYKLDDSIRNFYEECGGLQLLWTHKQNPDFEWLSEFKNQNDPLEFDWAMRDDHPAHDGIIMIPSIEQVFLNDWFESMYAEVTLEDLMVEFSGKEYNNLDFNKRLRPFDLFSRANEIAFFMDGTSNPPLIMGEDFQASYNDSKLIHFVSYIDFLIHCKGSVTARRNFLYEFEGHKSPMITSDQIRMLPEINLSEYGEDVGDSR